MPAWLASRWAAGAAAWIALAAATWFAGDALSLGGWRPLETAGARLALVVLAGAGWLAWELLRRRRLRRENARLLDGLAGGLAGEDSATRAAQEVQLLRKRFEEALGVLRKARFRGADGERRLVGELPWYMFIGGPGSGKTTALLNAGLRFPLGDPRAGETLQGVGGTRNCDWWFTDEAVLLDTAGRYTTQESDKEADAAAWLGFLDLLKRFRPRQPLNGAIITLSAADLAHWNDEEIANYAAHVRERVWELHTRLGVRLPLYLLVTKADLMAGFTEFFAEFDAAARAQVWGMTFGATEFDADTRGLQGRFDAEFQALERQLYALLPARLQEERDLQRRAALYRFPQQFRGLRQGVATFLDAAFSSGWPGETPLLRGVYFTSGTQEGSPIDRVLGTLARSFNLERKVQPPVVGSGKSYFLRRLLRDVMFAESGLAGADPAKDRALRRGRIGAYAALAGASLALLAAWGASYFANLRFVESAAAAAAEAKKAQEALPVLRAGDEARLLALLDRLDGLRRQEATGMARFAFFQGDKIDAQAARAYRRLLLETLLPHLAAGNLSEAQQKDFAKHIAAARAAQAGKP